MERQLRLRGVVLTLLALAMTVGLVQSPADAHEGEYHATAVAEGGSSLFVYNPPGIDPQQEFWLDAMAAIKHRVAADGTDWYRASFKVNNWKGVFSDDDSIWAAPGDAQAADLGIKIALYRRDTGTGILTYLTGGTWFTGQQGGYSYGCQGDTPEVAVTPGFTQVVARLWVKATRKFFYNGYWYGTPPQYNGFHATSSHRMDTTWWFTEPPSLGHTYETDPLANYFVSVPTSSTPNTPIAGQCPLWTIIP